ncbi:MAG: hypothetical protein HY855_26735 [Burkholderiales bacterium]|nr:hypothetical protein [Burkholderiales bacterium]
MRPWLALAAALAAGPAAAQEFGVYLNCKGKVEIGGKSHAAHVDLALRRNSQLAMVQNSDIVPTGQRLRLETTPQFYTLLVNAPVRGSVLYHDWLRGELFVWNPDLKKLHAIRIAVNRQTAALDGDLRDGEGASMGRLRMQCEAKDNDTVEAPKF